MQTGCVPVAVFFLRIGERLIRTENIHSPLSDQTIARLLGEKGMPIARRTVAKYREELGIPPAYQRKRA